MASAERLFPSRFQVGMTLPLAERWLRHFVAQISVAVATEAASATSNLAALDIEAGLELSGRAIAGEVAIQSQEFLRAIGRSMPVRVEVDVPLLAKSLEPIGQLTASSTIAGILERSAVEAFVNEEMAERMKHGFLMVWRLKRAKGGEPWPPLSLYTIMLKIRKGMSPAEAQRPLIETGALMRSMTEPTWQDEAVPGAVRQAEAVARPSGSRVEVSLYLRWGSRLPYAPLHMTGFRSSLGNPVPARPFIPGYFNAERYVASARPMAAFRQLVMDRIRSSLRAQAVLGRRALIMGRPLIGPRGGVVRPRRR